MRSLAYLHIYLEQIYFVWQTPSEVEHEMISACREGQEDIPVLGEWQTVKEKEEFWESLVQCPFAEGPPCVNTAVDFCGYHL